MKLYQWIDKRLFKLEVICLILIFMVLSFIDVSDGFHLIEKIFFLIVPFGVVATFLFSGKNRNKYAVLAILLAVPLFFSQLYIYFDCLIGLEGVLGYEYVYFSYTTFTTLGFGDITPKGVCKPFTSLEAIIGYTFMAYLASFFYDKLQLKK